MNDNEKLNLSEFWNQPEKAWRNVTKYDLRYYYQSGCTCTKEEAHQSYSQDIQCLLKKAKVNSNRYKALKSCESVAKVAHKNHVNKHFWNHEIQHFAQINSKEMLVEKELELLEKMTATAALRSYNQKSKASDSINPIEKENSKDTTSTEEYSNNATSIEEYSSDTTSTEEEYSSNINPIEEERNNNASPSEEERSDSSVYINDNRSSYVPKRKQEDQESMSTPTKRLNQQQTLSEKFRAYKEKIMHDTARGIDFSLETNVSELIALTNVMLLTPSQFSKYARGHFNDEVLNEWHKSIVDTLIVDVEKEARDISRSLDDIFYDLQKRRIKTRDAIQKLVTMSVGKQDHEAQILIGLANLIQKLPSQNLLSTSSIRETELWSSVFDPILTTLFSDPDRDILLRWTNIVPEEDHSEIIRVQPDAMICEIDQLNWGCTIGYGEAKIAEPNPNIAGLANDLLRLAFVTSKTVGDCKTRSVLAFQIHGYNFKAYVTQKMPDSSFYTMVELFEITFPRSIQEIDTFTNRKNIGSLISLYEVFWRKCCVSKQDENKVKEPEFSSLDISTIQVIKDGFMDRSRACAHKY